MSNTGTDLLGMNWTKTGHIDAWRRAATDFASSSPSAFAKRPWAFDFTVLPPSGRNASQLFLDTADQVAAFSAVESAHPAGPGAVLAKTESLHVDLVPGSTTCEFVPDPQHSRGSFAVEYLAPDNQDKIPCVVSPCVCKRGRECTHRPLLLLLLLPSPQTPILARSDEDR
jgi:hypothetical protein